MKKKMSLLFDLLDALLETVCFFFSLVFGCFVVLIHVDVKFLNCSVSVYARHCQLSIVNCQLTTHKKGTLKEIDVFSCLLKITFNLAISKHPIFRSYYLDRIRNRFFSLSCAGQFYYYKNSVYYDYV